MGEEMQRRNTPLQLKRKASILPYPHPFQRPFPKTKQIKEIQNLGQLCQKEITSYLVYQIQVLHTFCRKKDGLHITRQVRVTGRHCKPFESSGYLRRKLLKNSL